MRLRFNVFLLFLITSPFVCFAEAISQNTGEVFSLHVLYTEKPPYYYTVDNKPSGFLIEKSKKVFDSVNVKYALSSAPPIRILKEIELNQKYICSIGWFKNPEREKFAWFSLPFYTNEPMQIIFNKNARDQVTKYKSFNEILENENLKLGLVQGVSYGSIDPQIKSKQKNIVTFANNFQQNLDQLISNRFDWTITDKEEFDYYITLNKAKNLSALSLTDLPKGNQRYIICTQTTPTNIKNKINEAIQKLSSRL